MSKDNSSLFKALISGMNQQPQQQQQTPAAPAPLPSGNPGAGASSPLQMGANVAQGPNPAALSFQQSMRAKTMGAPQPSPSPNNQPVNPGMANSLYSAFGGK